VDCFVALNGSPGRLEFSEALFGIHSTFDGSMILFEDVIQVGSVATTEQYREFRPECRPCRLAKIQQTTHSVAFSN